MMLATVFSRAQCGIEAPLVTVETHISNGLPAFNIVGLAETAVRESRDRVRSALVNAGFEFPARRITVNLALPKTFLSCKREVGFMSDTKKGLI